jgi:hypothetical protein
VGKALFIPVSIASGFAAGFAGKKAFEVLWGVIDDQEPPDAEHREVQMPKMIAALALQGAIFTVARGLTDRAARMAFYRATGSWPGEEQPEQV